MPLELQHIVATHVCLDGMRSLCTTCKAIHELVSTNEFRKACRAWHQLVEWRHQKKRLSETIASVDDEPLDEDAPVAPPETI